MGTLLLHCSPQTHSHTMFIQQSSDLRMFGSLQSLSVLGCAVLRWAALCALELASRAEVILLLQLHLASEQGKARQPEMDQCIQLDAQTTCQMHFLPTLGQNI